MAGVEVLISDLDFPQVKEVDMKLIELARTMLGRIVTNDFNLNKVAQLRGVEVLNINELALFPTLTLTRGVGITKQISPSFLSPGTTQSTTSSAWTLGANLSIPVLNIPKLMSDIKAQGARVEQAAVTYEQTVQKAFGGSASAYQKATPLYLLKKNAPFHTWAVFGYGTADTKYGPGLREIAAASKDAGMTTTVFPVVGSGHDWNTVRTVLSKAIPLLSDHFGLGNG